VAVLQTSGVSSIRRGACRLCCKWPLISVAFGPLISTSRETARRASREVSISGILYAPCRCIEYAERVETGIGASHCEKAGKKTRILTGEKMRIIPRTVRCSRYMRYQYMR
jgi:hypothetical protein